MKKPTSLLGEIIFALVGLVLFIPLVPIMIIWSPISDYLNRKGEMKLKEYLTTHNNNPRRL